MTLEWNLAFFCVRACVREGWVKIEMRKFRQCNINLLRRQMDHCYSGVCAKDI